MGCSSLRCFLRWSSVQSHPSLGCPHWFESSLSEEVHRWSPVMKAARALSRDAPRISEQFCQFRTSWLWFRSEDEDKIKLDSKRGKSWVSKNNATSLTSLSAGFLISLLKSSHFLLLTGPVPFMMILDPPCKNERTYGNYMRVFSQQTCNHENPIYCSVSHLSIYEVITHHGYKGLNILRMPFTGKTRTWIFRSSYSNDFMTGRFSIS